METVKQRFLKKIDASNASGCWVWNANRHRQGYGKFKINNKDVSAHRASWILYIGEIPLGMLVCHKCDNPPCVRPDHLFLGTAKDNSRDRDNKGRLVAWHSLQTTAPCGHPYNMGAKTKRRCRECRNKYMKAYKRVWLLKRKSQVN